MRSLLRRLLFLSPLVATLLLTFCWCAQAREGVVILLRGTGCVGKSTLTNGLGLYAHDAGGPFIKPTPSDADAARIFPESEGKQAYYVLHGEELVKEYAKNSPKGTEGMWLYGVRKTLTYAKKIADAGHVAIVDIWVFDKESLDILDGTNVVRVLLYSPLRVLRERDEERGVRMQRTFEERVRLRRFVVGLLRDFYRPIFKDEGPKIPRVIDKISYEEIVQATTVVPDPSLLIEECKPSTYQRLLACRSSLIKNFGLEDGGSVWITPTVPYDIFINTAHISHEQSVDSIVEYARSHFGVFQFE